MTAGLVAVTGATGFLGRRLVERLLANGRPVRALVRRDPARSGSENSSIEIISGDLHDLEALSKLVEGADTVVHMAGLIKARDRSAFFRVNSEGARNIAHAASGRRLIHISSLAAREPALSDYAASKRAGEDAAREIHSDVTIVRPPAVFGPGDRETLALFKAALGPVIWIPRAPRARLAVADVDDVASVVHDLIDFPLRRSPITIGGARSSGYSWRELAEAALRAVGGRSFILETPPWALKVAGAACEQAGRLTAANPIFTLGKAREALHEDWSVSEAEEAWTADRDYTPLDEGLVRAVAWYRLEGWLR